jgi:hypothetical protein
MIESSEDPPPSGLTNQNHSGVRSRTIGRMSNGADNVRSIQSGRRPQLSNPSFGTVTPIADLPPNTPSIWERSWATGLEWKKWAYLSPVVRTVHRKHIFWIFSVEGGLMEPNIQFTCWHRWITRRVLLRRELPFPLTVVGPNAGESQCPKEVLQITPNARATDPGC